MKRLAKLSFLGILLVSSLLPMTFQTGSARSIDRCIETVDLARIICPKPPPPPPPPPPPTDYTFTVAGYVYDYTGTTSPVYPINVYIYYITGTLLTSFRVDSSNYFSWTETSQSDSRLYSVVVEWDSPINLEHRRDQQSYTVSKNSVVTKNFYVEGGSWKFEESFQATPYRDGLAYLLPRMETNSVFDDGKGKIYGSLGVQVESSWDPSLQEDYRETFLRFSTSFMSENIYPDDPTNHVLYVVEVYARPLLYDSNNKDHHRFRWEDADFGHSGSNGLALDGSTPWTPGPVGRFVLSASIMGIGKIAPGVGTALSVAGSVYSTLVQDTPPCVWDSGENDGNALACLSHENTPWYTNYDQVNLMGETINDELHHAYTTHYGTWREYTESGRLDVWAKFTVINSNGGYSNFETNHITLEV